MAKDSTKTVQKVDKKSPKKEKKSNVFARFGRYCKDVVSELKRVSWPSVSTLVKSTRDVLIFVAVVAIFVALLDLLFGTMLRQFLR